MSQLHIRSLTKNFDHPVLDGLDLDIAEGSLTAVVGPSGCGKTTLLRIIAGFETPDSGTVSIAGREVAVPGGCVPPHQRSVGYVAQDGALFPHLTVGQNIAYGLKGGLRRAEVRDQVARLLAMVSLDEHLLSRRPSELSGGQQQRVALARALARRPAVMLLDEPFSSLDTGLRAATRKAVAHTLADAGVTTLLVTHDQEEALSVADQVAVLRGGRFTQVGSPRELYLNPTDRFTAEFLGDCVFLPGNVRAGVVECTLGQLGAEGYSDGPVTIMLRPEQLYASGLSDTSADAVGTVVATEFLGPDVLLSIEPSGGSDLLTVRQHSFGCPDLHAKVNIDIVGRPVILKGCGA